VKKWVLLDTTLTPDGSEMQLLQRDGDYTIRVAGIELMSSRQRASEEKLGELGCEGLAAKKHPRVLIGGLGMAFTLRAVLRSAPTNTQVVVAELIPEIVRWNQDSKYPFGSVALKDRRVEVKIQDVGTLIAASSNGFDSILLDVDNGPSFLTVKQNRKLYDVAGLKAIKHALKSEGTLAVWSVNEEPEFVLSLEHAGFKVSTQRIRSHGTSGGMRTIFVAR
jgi:spermidine synthase